MAIYDNLPVFKQAYDLLLQILRFTSSVQRDFRYTVGETLKKDVIELCLCIYRANASVEKLPQIEAARERMEMCIRDRGKSGTSPRMSRRPAYSRPTSR